ncbi:MAG: hypothetical protein EON87_02675 [Brevundimonas sp.]|nr:MAG: hypothetical protein EON87_02675 [Brevundimonas sp.]
MSMSGRRLVRTRAGWSVLMSADRRRRGRMLLQDAEVATLVESGRLRETERGMYVVADVVVQARPVIEPWAFMVAARRDASRQRGRGFSALAWRARHGDGPLTMRHVEAGLRLITDVEQRENSRGLTMDWDAGPVDRQRRSGTSGGFRGIAAKASERVRRVKRHMSVDGFNLVWALCVEALPLRAIGARFGISRRSIEAVIAEALEEIALAYDR